MNNREINEKIEELRAVLNTLMSGDYRKNYGNILELSIKLDNLIAECYKMKDSKID